MVIKKEILYGSDVVSNPIVVNSGSSLIRLNGSQGVSFSMTSDQLSAHLMLIGSTFSGKTNVIKSLIKQLKSKMKPEDIMLVFDSKFDFREFHSPGDYVLSNRKSSCPNTVIWNIFGDITADGWNEESIYRNAKELAKVGFADSIENSTQPFFPKAAMNIFAAIITAMALIGKDDIEYRKKYLNNRALRNYLRKLDAKMLADFIGKFPQLSGVLKYVGSGRSDQSLGVFAELEQTTDSILNGAFAEQGTFSVRRAVRRRGGITLFLEFDPSCGAYGTALKMTTDLFLKESLSPESRQGRVYVIVDELKLLSSLIYFEHALNFGRSLGVSVVAGIQSIEQLYELYGEYGGKNIASGFQSSFVFRTNNAATREYIKGIHGQNLSCIQYLDNTQKPKESTREGNVVEDWHISALKQGEAIVSLPSEKPFIFLFAKYS